MTAGSSSVRTTNVSRSTDATSATANSEQRIFTRGVGCEREREVHQMSHMHIASLARPAWRGQDSLVRTGWTCKQ